MKVILFGGYGLVGQGVLRACLRDDRCECVLAIGRSSTGQTDPKLREVVLKDIFDLDAELQGNDASFFCLGVSAASMNEADYTSDFRSDPGLGAGAGGDQHTECHYLDELKGLARMIDVETVPKWR